jgi:hypothetical protein
MGGQSKPLFHEEQSLRQPRLLILTAIPPVAMLLLAIWQVGLGHPWGKQPMSNAGIVGWTIFLWLIYFRLITIKLVTDVLPNELSVAMRGLWRSYRVSLDAVRSIRAVTFDPVRDWGGYGVRSTSRGKAYIARGNQAVELELKKEGVVLVSSNRPAELLRALESAMRRPAS